MDLSCGERPGVTERQKKRFGLVPETDQGPREYHLIAAFLLSWTDPLPFLTTHSRDAAGVIPRRASTAVRPPAPASLLLHFGRIWEGLRHSADPLAGGTARPS